MMKKEDINESQLFILFFLGGGDEQLTVGFVVTVGM